VLGTSQSPSTSTTRQTWVNTLSNGYPNPNSWSVDVAIHKRDIYRFAQQWLTEGIPFCFRDEPMVYERAREKIARALSESPKHISLTGSGRLGYSLGSAFGAAFGDKSDLDLFIVSPDLFNKLAVDGRLFAGRVKSGDAVPKSDTEKKYWFDTADKMEAYLSKYYIDHKLIPRAERYPAVTLISKSLSNFESNLWINSNQKRRWKTSVRVYRDWNSVLSKIGGSLIRSLIAKGYKIDGN